MTDLLLRLVQAPSRMLRALYAWTIQWAATPVAAQALFWIALAEASVFPVPPDVLLMPMVVAAPKRWWRIAAICTAGSVLGALVGYGIGWGFYESVGQWIVRTYHLQEHVETVRRAYEQNAFLTIFAAAFTPIPFKVITVAAGLFRIPLAVLVIAAIVGRAMRFFLVAALLRACGERLASWIEKYFDWLALLFVVLLVGGFVALRYLN